MIRTALRVSWLSACLVLVACPTTPVRDNPLDPKNPSPAAGAITGTVAFDTTGQLLADVALTEAVVRVSGASDIAVDSTGHFRVDGVTPGEHSVEVSAPYNDLLRFETVAVGPGEVKDLGALTLVRGRGEISGALFVAGREVPDGGCPAGSTACGDHSGSQVSVVDHPASEPRFTVTNLSGDYQLSQVAAGKRKLGFRRDGYDPAQLDLELLPGERKRLPDYTLGAGFSARVQGKVQLEGVDPPNQLYTQATAELRGGVASTGANDTGDFLLSSPLGGTFTLSVYAVGYERKDFPGIVLRHNQTVDLTAQLGGPVYLRKARGAVVAKVQVQGTAPDGVQVCGEGTAFCAVSTQSGDVRIDDVPAGLTFRLVATKRVGLDEYSGVSGTRTIAVGPATDFGTLTVSKISGDFQLEGRVIDTAGAGMVSSRNYTVDDWVRIDLSRIAQPTYDFVSVGLDGGFGGWQQIPINAPFCPDAGATSPLCVQLGVEGRGEVLVKLGNAADGGTQQLGPFRASIVLDRTPPTGVSVVVNGGAAFINAADSQTMSLSVAASDSFSPLLSMRLAAVTAPANALTALDAAAVGPYSINPGVPVPDYTLEAEKRIAVRVYDSAGNSAQAQDTIVLDKTAPQQVTLRIATNDAGFVTQSLVGVGAGADAGDLSSVRLANDSTVYPYVTVPFGPGQTAQTTSWLLLAGEGVRTVYGQFVDQAGNVSSPPASASVTVDFTPPPAPQVAVGENPCLGTPTDTKPNGWTKNTTVCVTVTPGPGSDAIAIDQGCGAPQVISVSALTPIACALSGGDGEKTIVVRALDLAGNSSAPVTRSVRLDTVAPGLPTFSILASPQAQPGYVNSQVTVFSALTAVGDTDVAELQFDENGTLSPWAPFALSGIYILATAAEAAHPVQLRVRDLAENVSPPSGSSVTLDTTLPLAPPVAMPLRNANGFVPVSTGLLVNVATGVLDSNYFALLLDGALACSAPANCVQTAAPATSFTVSITANAQSFLRVRAKDRAGNLGPETLLPVTHDGAFPAAPVIVSPSADACGTPPEPYTAQSTQVVSLATYSPEVNFDGFQLISSTAPCIGAASGWTPTTSTNDFLFALQPGANHLCVRAIDLAGNPSAAAQVRVVQDAVAPTTPSFGPDQTLNSDTVLIHLQSASVDSSPFAYEVIGGAYANWTPLPLNCRGLRAYAGGAGCTPPDAGTCAVDTTFDGGLFVELATLEDRDQLYFFRAVDLAGNTSGISAPVSVTERSTYQLSADLGGLSYDRPQIEADRVVWTANSSGQAVGVQVFDLLKLDPLAGDAPVTVDAGTAPGTLSGASSFGQLLAWAEAGDIRFCRIQAATGNCGAVTTRSTPAELDQYPVTTGDHIVFTNSTTSTIVAFDVDAGTTTALGTGPFAGQVSARRVFDGDGGTWPANIANLRAAWPLSTGTIQTRRTDGAMVSIATPSQPNFAWTDGRWVLWDSGPSEYSKSVLGCREPFAGVCTSTAFLPAGQHAGVREFTAFILNSGAQVSTMNDQGAVGVPELATPTASRLHSIAGIAQRTALQAGHLVYVRFNGSRDQSVDLWDAASVLKIDPRAHGAKSPAVSGAHVVWLDPRDGAPTGYDVYEADLDRGRITRRTAASAARSQLALDYPYVAWVEAAGPDCGANACVRWMNLATSAAGKVGNSNCSGLGACGPRVSGARVAWTDYAGGANLNILLFDIVSSAQSNVANTAAVESQVGFSGERLVWLEESGGVYRVMTSQLGTATAACPAGPECLAGTSGCKFNRGPTTRANPSVYAPAGVPCGGGAAWEEDSGLASARLGVYDWVRNAGRVLNEDIFPLPAPSPLHYGPQRNPQVTAEWVAFDQPRTASAGSKSDMVRLYWWRADTIGTAALGTTARLSPSSDGRSVAFLEGQSGFETVQLYRPPRIP